MSPTVCVHSHSDIRPLKTSFVTRLLYKLSLAGDHIVTYHEHVAVWFPARHSLQINFWSELWLSVGFTGKIEFVVKWNYSRFAWILGGICGRPIILILNFSLLVWGVRKCSVQPWASLLYVVNLEMNNSLKWVLFNVVSGQITSDALWK